LLLYAKWLKQRHLKLQAEEIIKSAQYEISGKYMNFMLQLLCHWTHKEKLCQSGLAGYTDCCHTNMLFQLAAITKHTLL
jgi:hypothetical protein